MDETKTEYHRPRPYTRVEEGFTRFRSEIIRNELATSTDVPKGKRIKFGRCSHGSMVVFSNRAYLDIAIDIVITFGV